ncbi:MAG: type II secretion system protein [Phycisphaeraceae bacterium]|nr:type II secretion system protein [Phycisphaeraceae bacterium]
MKAIFPRAGRQVVKRSSGFTIIELLVTISIIGMLIGILMPVLSVVRTRARKATCASNLRQIGVMMEVYAQAHQGLMPVARYMPPPFLSADDAPPLTEVLASYGDSDPKQRQEVYHCPGDVMQVFDLCGSSYMYQTEFSGILPENHPMVKHMGLTLSEVVIARDFDGGDFGTDKGIVPVGFFHDVRNLLFADGHAGNFR